jgi:hypothetical protein
LQVRQRLGLDGRILDVDYEMVRSDPMQIIRDAYALSPHTLTDDAGQKMLAWHHENEQGKHGQHTYSLAEFGLTDTQIQSNFGTYMQRFIHDK